MSEVGQEYAAVTFPEEIELCGVCGSRAHRCGHGSERPAVKYVRASDVAKPETAESDAPNQAARLADAPAISVLSMLVAFYCAITFGYDSPAGALAAALPLAVFATGIAAVFAEPL